MFDGVTFDKDEDITEFQKFIPDSKNSSIIYTSVDRTLVRKQRLLYPIAVKVRPLNEKDAMALLYKGLGIKQPTTEQTEKARILVRHLECLPLAIHAMSHRLHATGKAIEKYHIESYSTDSKLAQPYMGIMADLRRFNHPEALNLIHILCFFGHNVPVAMLNLGRQVLKDAKIYIKSSERSSTRTLEWTLATLIKYGLIDRTLTRYDLDQSGSDLSGRTGSQDSLTGTLETIDIIKIHTVVQGFCCDSLKEDGQFVFWVDIAIKLFCHSFDTADAQIKRQPQPGLVKDYREYETHGQRLLSHFPEKLAKTPPLRETRAKLQRTLGRVKEEIQKRSPEASQEIFRPQASVFDRTTSLSDDSPDTPRSTPSRVSTLGLGIEKPQVDSPLSIDGHYNHTIIASEDKEPLQIPDYPEDAGYTADQEEPRRSYPLTPTRSEDTARPPASSINDQGSGWQIVTNRKFSKSKLARHNQSCAGSIKRPRARRDLGSFHPSAAKSLVSTVGAMGSTSRPRSESQGRRLGSSEAMTSLTTIHHASPPPSRGDRIASPRRPLSRPTTSQVHEAPADQATVDEDIMEQLLPTERALSNQPPISGYTTPLVEDEARGRSRDTVRSQQGNARPSPLAAGYVPQPQVPQTAPNAISPFSTPPGTGTNQKPSSSSPGFVYANQYHSSDPYLTGFSPPSTYNENISSMNALPSITGRNPAPLPYEEGVTITAKRRLPADFRGHHSSGIYQPRRSPSTQRYFPQTAYAQPPLYYSAPLPPGYSSQPMSRNASGQSNQYPETEPPLYPPSFSPHLATVTPASPRDRLPDGCSPRKSPKFAQAFPAYRDDVFDPHFHPSNQSQAQAIAATGTWADPISPLTPSQDHDISLSMSRSHSGSYYGPGITFDGSNGIVQFGQAEPVSLEDARQRTMDHARRLRAFEEGIYRPLHRPTPGRWGYAPHDGPGMGVVHAAGTVSAGNSTVHLVQPYPDINLIPTPSDESSLRQLLEGSLGGRKRGLSAPGQPDMDFISSVEGRGVGLGLGVEFPGQGQPHGQGHGQGQEGYGYGRS